MPPWLGSSTRWALSSAPCSLPPAWQIRPRIHEFNGPLRRRRRPEAARQRRPRGLELPPRGFFFFIFKKKFKNICPFSNISKIYPGRPPIGRQAQCVIFFFKFATKSLEKKKQALSPVGGRQAPLFFSDFYFCRDLF